MVVCCAGCQMRGCEASSLIRAFSQHVLHRLGISQNGPLVSHSCDICCLFSALICNSALWVITYFLKLYGFTPEPLKQQNYVCMSRDRFLRGKDIYYDISNYYVSVTNAFRISDVRMLRFWFRDGTYIAPQAATAAAAALYVNDKGGCAVCRL